MTDQPPEKPEDSFEKSLLEDIERFSGVNHQELAPARGVRPPSIADSTALSYPNLLHAHEIAPPEDLIHGDGHPRTWDGRKIPAYMLPQAAEIETDPFVIHTAKLGDARIFMTRLVNWLNKETIEVPYTFDLDPRRNLGPLRWAKGSVTGGSSLDPTFSVKFVLQGGPPIDVTGRNAEIAALEARCKTLGLHVERISGKGAATPGVLPKVRIVRAVRAQLMIGPVASSIDLVIRSRNVGGRGDEEKILHPDQFDTELLARLADDLCGSAWRSAVFDDASPAP